MREAIEVEGAVQLAVDPFQQVEIEGGGYAGRVVIGCLQPLPGFLEIDADQQPAAGPELPPKTRQKGLRFDGVEVADGGTGEEGDGWSGPPSTDTGKPWT